MLPTTLSVVGGLALLAVGAEGIVRGSTSIALRLGVTTLAVMAGMLLLVLLLRPILLAARGLFFGKHRFADSADTAAPARLDGNAQGAALPSAQSTPANCFIPARADTAELAATPSVTEERTRKLNR
jgi:hypothetical protein